MSKAYGLSKLYVIWIMRHFASEMQKAGIKNITFNTVHPGSAMTNLGRESTKAILAKIVYFLWRPLMTTPAVGAISSINAATSPEMEGVTGKYFGKKGEEKPSEKYYSLENEKIVWDYCKTISKDYL
jgi:NAD(P)-dependent dehydrogenase (short-subunit alcohol dehydrogenase family)